MQEVREAPPQAVTGKENTNTTKMKYTNILQSKVQEAREAPPQAITGRENTNTTKTKYTNTLQGKMQEAREAPPQAGTGRAEPQRGSGRRRGGRFVGTDQTDLICQNYSEKEEEEDLGGKDNQDGDQVERFCCWIKITIQWRLNIQCLRENRTDYYAPR